MLICNFYYAKYYAHWLLADVIAHTINNTKDINSSLKIADTETILNGSFSLQINRIFVQTYNK
jgi:hypothetical protein